MKRPSCRWTCALAVLFLSTASRADQAFVLTPAATIEIPHSMGAFDLLRIDATRNRLMAAHEEAGTADYIDLQSEKLITRLKLGDAVDSAVDPEARFYYVSVQDGKRVAVVDAQALTAVASIKTPGPPDAILYDPKNRRVYVTHDDGGEVWIIDPVARRVIGSVPIPGAPELMVYDPRVDLIYLNIKTRDAVVVIDPAANQVVSQWSTLPATRPHGIAVDTATQRILSAGANGQLVALDARTGRVASSIEIAPKVDQIALDAAGGLLYCAGAAEMSVVRTSGGKLTLLGNFPTAGSARNVAIDPKTRTVWTTYTSGKRSFARSWRPSQ
jgi:YVTN family beta-propeller protein